MVRDYGQEKFDDLLTHFDHAFPCNLSSITIVNGLKRIQNSGGSSKQ